MSQPILVIGIGNEYRSDDAAGLLACRLLKAEGLQDTLIIESNGDGVALMEAWETARKVFLIDAVSSGAKAGTIHRFDALTQPIPTQLSLQSSHVFGVAEAIGLARALHQLPANLIIYGIEGKNFTTGTTLSHEVESSVHEVVRQMMHEVQVACRNG